MLLTPILLMNFTYSSFPYIDFTYSLILVIKVRICMLARM